jgi:glycosyltransferase 2 family protein
MPKKSPRRWLWLGLSAVFLGLIAYNLREGGDWRDFRWDELWVSLSTANPGYLAAAVLTTLSSYLVRAYRWGFFLDPIKRASVRVLFSGQILGFSAIYLIGRPGEVVRPAYIAKKEGVSYTAMAAVWLLERIYDTIAVALLFSAALFWAPLEMVSKGEASFLPAAHWVALVTLFGTGVCVALLVAFRVRAESMKLRTPKFLRFLSPEKQQHFERFLRSFADGLGVIRNWKDLAASVISTAVLWFVNVTFFYFVLQSMSGKIGGLNWITAALVLFSAVLGLIVQIPGIGGGFQLVIIKVMIAFLGVSVEDATGASILLWVMLAFPCVLLGLVLLVHEGLSFKKLEGMAKEEREALQQKT